jgi:hypothetical protein
MTRHARRLWRIAAAILAAAVIAGCGAKSAPIPPSQTHPGRINDLSAVSVAGGVRLSWSRPMTYTGGKKLRDLAGFRLMRAEGPGPFGEIAELPVTDQERFQKVRRFSYVDRSTQMGQTYLYIIVAETSDGYESDPSNVVKATRTRPKPPPNPANFVLPTPGPLLPIPTPTPTP